MIRSSISLRAIDGRPLAASWYEAADADADTPVVVIAPALAVRKSLYHHFAVHLSEQGFSVLTFDYRGTGGSRASNLRASVRREGAPARPAAGTDAGNLSRWGELDLEGALQYVERARPRAKIAVVAHSISGHLLPLAPSAARLVSSAVVVATPAASWRQWPRAQAAAAWLLFALVLPLVITVRGFLPGRLLGGPEDLSGEVVREWAAWGRAGESPGEAKAHQLTIPVGVLSFEDDRYGPHATVAAFGAMFTRAKLQHRRLDTAEVGAALGHFGWVNATAGRKLWHGLSAWIGHSLDGKHSALLAPARFTTTPPETRDTEAPLSAEGAPL